MHRHAAGFGVAQRLWLATVVIAHREHDIGFVLRANHGGLQPEAAYLTLEARAIDTKRIDAHGPPPVAMCRLTAIDGRRRAALFEAKLVGDRRWPWPANGRAT